MNPTQQNLATVFVIVLTLISFVYFAAWTDDFRVALAASAVLCGLTCFGLYKYHVRQMMIALRNRWESYYVVGCHPDTGEPPFMRDFAEECLFVPNHRVHIEAENIRKQLAKATAGIPIEDRHPVRILTFSFREPVNENAIVERWKCQEGEEIDNSYPARIVSDIEEDRKRTHLEQYKAGISGYRRVVLNQHVPKNYEEATVIEW